MWKLHETIPMFRQWSWESEGILMTITRGQQWVLNINGKIKIHELGNYTPEDMMLVAEGLLRSNLLRVIEKLDA